MEAEAPIEDNDSPEGLDQLYVGEESVEYIFDLLLLRLDHRE